MNAAATFENVEKTYKTGIFRSGGIQAVRGISLQVPTGSIFGLLGPNRAGKTTLVKILLSLSSPTGGVVQRLGASIRHRDTLARVGYMHENHAFPRYLSAHEVLHFYGGLTGVKTSELSNRSSGLLERVGLADRGREPITRFSKGMVQRLGLAQALINDPDLLILDEPTEGLDLDGRRLLRDVVRERKKLGKTVLLVTHVLSEVEELCDELGVIVQGKLAYRGRLDDLLGKGESKKGLEEALSGLYRGGTS